ncbi:small glutamine-rich tetratricopeptide repeat-containing protein beta-like [Babylonia areolata]|uniref:small glutamine-rich tetratricopeptide repeat-containing protein beta-like n=1 Tax=Babylonia areolata TaxID=304850 RepID=UPI003FCFE672
MADVKRLVFSILTFLEDQKKTGGLDDEQVESLEVSIQCLETVYGLSTSDQNQAAHYHVPRNLLDIFNSQISETDSDLSSLSLHEPTPEEREEAEKLKNRGNEFMKSEKFSDALESYTQAIKRDGKNAVYYCNRAAAYSKLNKHQQAIEDCTRALAIDTSYSKAYGRMGIAYTALNDHEQARECYRKALELDPDNQSYQNNLEIAEQKLREAAAGAGFAAGPAGGMDIGALLSNPQLMNMATNMMSNPQMQQMLSSIMSNQSGGEGGLSSLLQAGQQLATQIQQQNPELVQQLRSQLRQPDQDQQPGSQ